MVAAAELKQRKTPRPIRMEGKDKSVGGIICPTTTAKQACPSIFRGVCTASLIDQKRAHLKQYAQTRILSRPNDPLVFAMRINIGIRNTGNLNTKKSDHDVL